MKSTRCAEERSLCPSARAFGEAAQTVHDLLKHHACLLREYVPLPMVAILLKQIPQQRAASGATGDWTAEQYMDAFMKALEVVKETFCVRPAQLAVLYTASTLILPVLFDIESKMGELFRDGVFLLYARQEVPQCLEE